MADPTLDGWRALACAILVQAVSDAKDGNGHSAEARAWLASQEAAGLVLELDIDPAHLGRVIGGLPELLQPALPGLL